ncbi:hypothetical protein M407DRAFT_201584 [Tulasnella calospora MUT 4182]|uniref:Uncharacterized protein n=1 Tax=Tulasnella calospora MUT 4182 TaxID=1051891 RepID=A0A0C3QI34_9AGAM|nr:hypothetical protein M407DRAFT_201584 [Tulasnella calospora MUT 4182]
MYVWMVPGSKCQGIVYLQLLLLSGVSFKPQSPVYTFSSYSPTRLATRHEHPIR